MSTNLDIHPKKIRRKPEFRKQLNSSDIRDDDGSNSVWRNQKTSAREKAKANKTALTDSNSSVRLTRAAVKAAQQLQESTSNQTRSLNMYTTFSDSENVGNRKRTKKSQSTNKSSPNRRNLERDFAREIFTFSGTDLFKFAKLLRQTKQNKKNSHHTSKQMETEDDISEEILSRTLAKRRRKRKNRKIPTFSEAEKEKATHVADFLSQPEKSDDDGLSSDQEGADDHSNGNDGTPGQSHRETEPGEVEEDNHVPKKKKGGSKKMTSHEGSDSTKKNLAPQVERTNIRATVRGFKTLEELVQPITYIIKNMIICLIKMVTTMTMTSITPSPATTSLTRLMSIQLVKRREVSWRESLSCKSNRLRSSYP